MCGWRLTPGLQVPAGDGCVLASRAALDATQSIESYLKAQRAIMKLVQI